MLKDEVPTMSYRNSILYNKHLFKGKIVLDVGCGSGILSMFAARAGASRVIGVDRSSIVDHTKKIVEDNGLSDIVTIVRGKIEEIELPHGIDKVDIIISEWMGYCLFYECMLDTVVFARKKWLANGGLIFPDRATLYICGIENEQFKEDELASWKDLYGFDMSYIKKLALTEPVVDSVIRNKVLTNSCLIKELDILTCTKEDIPFSNPFYIQVKSDGYCQALVTYFNIEFSKCHNSVCFSTAPEAPSTHWKQTVFYLDSYLACKKGEEITGLFKMKANSRNFRNLDFGIKIDFEGELCTVREEKYYRMK